MRDPVFVLMTILAIALPAGAQQIDLEAMQRWGSAEVVYYAVEGIYSGETSMTATMGGFADVVDRVSFTFEWSLTEAKLLNVTSLENYPSEVQKLRDFEAACLPPVLKGVYEQATVQEVTNGLGGSLDMKIETSYPDVEVAQSCTASRKAVRAEKSIEVYTLPVPSPIIMAMGAAPTDTLSFTPDKKSMIFKDGNWTWTFTPDTATP
ncbi:MAG: hypothetical protein V4628_00095 [Pseudomonadota bacterium]